MAGWSLLQVDQFRQTAHLVTGRHTGVCTVGYHLRLTLETIEQYGIENFGAINSKLRSDRGGNINITVHNNKKILILLSTIKILKNLTLVSDTV